MWQWVTRVEFDAMYGAKNVTIKFYLGVLGVGRTLKLAFSWMIILEID